MDEIKELLLQLKFVLNAAVDAAPTFVVAAAAAAHPSTDRAHRRWSNPAWADRDVAGPEVAVHRPPTANTHACRTLPARVVV